ncbi:PhaM family polyhydroxyalkanoate granule multifunctional regulatory protein [Rugamonas apoptosis]|uniref:Uncharacterized protein n=1 Tax=Rugamonas apoptosis TaxID=2758570 RepID=A0A7W2F5G0_9BURK|nr:PhaM family polyhydroxyalkanoate granule multifunctional regulatory protein [Rugamonas apoptosis]MBA5685461.1 hypothetical protein [Rugamonas apoptosis]
MSTPQMPNIPGAAVMTDTLDFVKNLWGSMSVPGLTAPTLSVDELDKKINDLKAVETWLNLNMSMLRGSIQALEVQRGTIATLKSVGASMAAAVNKGGGDTKSMLDAVPYASVFFQQAQAAAAKAPVTPPPSAPAPAPAAAAPASPFASAGSANPAAASSSAAKPAASPGADAAAQMANPAIWWNLLQDQFKQAVSSTLGPEAMTSAAGKMAAAATAAATSVAKSAANAATAASAAAKPTTAPAAQSAKPAPAKAGAKTPAKPRAVKAKPAAKPGSQE